jgi:hypothetical protein
VFYEVLTKVIELFPQVFMLHKESYEKDALSFYNLGQDKNFYAKPEISESSFCLQVPVHLTYNELVTHFDQPSTLSLLNSKLFCSLVGLEIKYSEHPKTGCPISRII